MSPRIRWFSRLHPAQLCVLVAALAVAGWWLYGGSRQANVAFGQLSRAAAMAQTEFKADTDRIGALEYHVKIEAADALTFRRTYDSLIHLGTPDAARQAEHALDFRHYILEIEASQNNAGHLAALRASIDAKGQRANALRGAAQRQKQIASLTFAALVFVGLAALGLVWLWGTGRRNNGASPAPPATSAR